jgi:hypothetical protein
MPPHPQYPPRTTRPVDWSFHTTIGGTLGLPWWAYWAGLWIVLDAIALIVVLYKLLQGRF